MDTKNLQEIEKFLFKYKKKDSSSARSMSDIVGVLIGLKPSAVMDFSSAEMENVDCMAFRELLGSVGLKSIFCHHQMMSVHKLVCTEHVYISKNLKTAIDLHDCFMSLWISMDDYGLVIDMKSWVKSTRQIGKLLGYPDTAVDSFIKNETEKRSGDDSLTIISEKYRYFAHSKKHADREVGQYNKPLDDAIKKYAPSTDKIWNKE